MHRLARRLIPYCAAALLLGGCGHHEAPPTATGSSKPAPAPAAKRAPSTTPAKPVAPTPPTPVASTAVPVAASTAFHVTGLSLGSSIDAGYVVTRPENFFRADTATLYASVATDGRTDKATLGVRWRYLEGNGALVNELNQTLAANGPAHTAFTVHNPDRWPVGKYRVEISLDGKPVAQQDFMVTGSK